MAAVADTEEDHQRQETAETADRSTGGDEPTRSEARKQERSQAWRSELRALRTRLVHIATSVATIIAVVFAVVLAFRIVFAIFPVNPGNSLVEFVRSWADALVLFFGHLFTPDDQRVAVLVNYGLAAVFWLVAGRIAAGLIRRLG